MKTIYFNNRNMKIANTSNISLIVLGAFFSLFFLIADFKLNVTFFVIILTLVEIFVCGYSIIKSPKIKIKKKDLSLLIVMIIVLLNIRNIEYLNEQPFYVFSLILSAFLIMFIKPGFAERYYVLNMCLLVSVFVSLIVFCSRFIPILYLNTYLKIISDTSRDYNDWIMSMGYSGVVGGTIGITAQYLVVGIAIVLGRYLFGKEISSFILLAVMILALVFTGRRSEVIAAGVALLGTLYFMVDGRKKQNYIVIAFGLILAMILVYFLIVTDSITYSGENRMLSSIFLFIHGVDVSNGRGRLYTEAVRLFMANPLFGIGWGGFRNYSRNILTATTNVHNVYLQLLCEIGIVGFACLVIPFFYFVRCTFKKAKEYKGTKHSQFAVFSLFMVIYLSIISLFDNAFYHDEFWLLFSVIVFCTNNMGPTRHYDVNVRKSSEERRTSLRA